MLLILFISVLWIICTNCSLRIKTHPQDTFINVFDADDDQQYYLYPIKTKKHGYSLDNVIKKLSNNDSTFYESIISIKTTHTQNENIFLLPYEICMGSVVGMNKYYSSFIIQTAAHCIVDHPQFQMSSRKKKTASSLLIYIYSKTYNNPVLYLGVLWLVIIVLFTLSYYYLSCKFILFAFALLVIIVNVSVYFTKIEMLNNNSCQLLPIFMDIKHSTYRRIHTSLHENDITISKTCDVLYFSFHNLLDYNHAFMDPQQWRKIVFERGDFAFLQCQYEPRIYTILSKYLRASYPSMVDGELTKTLTNIKKNGILNFDNLNKYVMLSGTFQRFVFDAAAANTFVELHRKQICKQYIEQCNKNEKVLKDLTEWIRIKQYENEESIDYKSKQYTSIGKVTFVHSNHYFIGKFGAIQGWSGTVGVAGDNANIIETNIMSNTFHCILVGGSLDLAKYRGNWCMLVTHCVYAATYYKLINSKSEYFDIAKLNRTYKLYARKMKKKGYSLNKFKLTKNSAGITHDTKIEF